jgi:hypothetical protein
VTNFRDLWTLMAFKSQTQQQYCSQSSFNLGIVNCTLYLIWRGSLHYARPTSNHPRVKLRCLRNNLIFILQKNHSLRSTGANGSFTYMHKLVVEIYPQETRNNGLVGLILSLHCLYDHHLRCRTFPVTKGNYKNKVELGYVSECRKFSYYYRLCFPATRVAIYST